MTSICIDARWLQTGIGTYTFNLIRELGRRDELDLHVLTLRCHMSALSAHCSDVRVVDTPIYSIAEQFAVTAAARNFSLLHVPHYNAPLPRQGNLLVTIHDLTHILAPGFHTTWKTRLYAQPMLRLAARKAAHIFTVSEYSKRQIMERLGVSGEKVTVAYNGVAPHFFPERGEEARETFRRACGVDRPYILCVGNLKPHKNIDGLLRAFALLNSRVSLSCDLVVVGDNSALGPALRNLAAKLGISGATRFVGRVTDDELRAAYSAAELTVLPSFEEGFGLPVLESMACGTPVACSQAASLPEVGGNAAVYFDPHDVASMAEAMRMLLESSADRERYRRLGLENATRFTWTDCADRHLHIYRQFNSVQDHAHHHLGTEPSV